MFNLFKKKKKVEKDLYTLFLNGEISEDYFLAECGKLFLLGVNQYYREIQMAVSAERMSKKLNESLEGDLSFKDKYETKFYRDAFTKICEKDIIIANMARIKALGAYLVINKVNKKMNTHYTFEDCEHAWKTSSRYYNILEKEKEIFPMCHPAPVSFIEFEKKQYNLLKNKYLNEEQCFDKKTYDLLF